MGHGTASGRNAGNAGAQGQNRRPSPAEWNDDRAAEYLGMTTEEYRAGIAESQNRSRYGVNNPANETVSLVDRINAATTTRQLNALEKEFQRISVEKGEGEGRFKISYFRVGETRAIENALEKRRSQLKK